MNNIIRNTLIGLALVWAAAAIELELEGSQGMEGCTVLINVPYKLCVSYSTLQALQQQKPLYVGFTASEDFQSLIGRVQIPSELASEQNLKSIYHIAGKLNKVSSVIMGHQLRERALQDQIVTRNIHKQRRIILLGVVQVLIIVLCGVYQVFALRRFLIDKNLY